MFYFFSVSAFWLSFSCHLIALPFCVLAASASAFNDDEDSQYLQASISGVQLSLTKHLFTKFPVMIVSHHDHNSCCHCLLLCFLSSHG